MKYNKKVLYLLFFLFLVGSIMIYESHFFEAINSEQSWSETHGMVISTTVKVQDYLPDQSYFPVITYQFSINGTAFTSSNRYVGGMKEAYSKYEAKYIINQYTIGSNISIYYNPSNPHDCAIYLGVQTPHIVLMGLGCVLILISVLLTLLFVYSYLKNRNISSIS